MFLTYCSLQKLQGTQLKAKYGRLQITSGPVATEKVKPVQPQPFSDGRVRGWTVPARLPKCIAAMAGRRLRNTLNKQNSPRSSSKITFDHWVLCWEPRWEELRGRPKNISYISHTKVLSKWLKAQIKISISMGNKCVIQILKCHAMAGEHQREGRKIRKWVQGRRIYREVRRKDRMWTVTFMASYWNQNP